MTKKIIIASLLIIFIGLAVFFKYFVFVDESILKSLIYSLFTTLIFLFFGFLAYEFIDRFKEHIMGGLKNKFIISLFIIFVISYIFSKFSETISVENSNLLGALGITFVFGILIGIVLTIYKFFKEGFNSELVRWVFWIVFLGSFYGLFDYVKEEYGFANSLGLYLVIMILFFLLYFFVVGPIAKSEDEARANKDKIKELEKRIDNIEKDK